MGLYLAFNLIFSTLAARWAYESFRDGMNGFGWIHLIMSAVNAAAALNLIFSN